MRGAVERAERAGAARADTAREQVAAVLREMTPGADVTIEGEAVVLRASGLRWRAATDPALRSVAGMLR